MRQLHILFAVGLLALASIPVPPAVAEEAGSNSDYRIGPEHDIWAGVSRPEPLHGATPADGEILQPFEVYFSEDYAAVPEVPDSQFMIVQIVEGTFALAPAEGTFIVDPADDKPIGILEEIRDEPYYLPTDSYVRDTEGKLCTSVCAIPGKTAVQVTSGSTITALAGSICLWCLLNSNADQQDKGLMIVSVLLPQGVAPSEFSWARSWEETQGKGASASANTAAMALGWAMFNPQARCRNP